MLAEASLLVALSIQQGRGAEACMGYEQLKLGVEKRLKRRVFVEPSEASLQLVVIFTRKGSDTEARIELSSSDGAPRGTRSLVASGHCSALDDSLALSVALLVDQPPEPEPPPPPPPPPPAPTAEGAAAPPPAPAPAPPEVTRGAPPTPIVIPPEVAAPREPWHAHVGVSAVGAWGVLPALRPALALQVKVVPRQLVPIALQVAGFAPATAERDADSGARFRLFRFGLSVCPSLRELGAVSLSLCVGQTVGWLTVEGFGFDHDRNDRRIGYALVAGGEGRLRLLAPISARAYLGAEVPLARDRFTSSGRGATQLFEPSPVAVSGEIGLEAALW